MEVLTRGNASGQPYIDLQLRPAELQAIGRVTTNWAFLEFLILRETRGLATFLEINVPEDAFAVSFRRRRNLWEELTRRASESLPDAAPQMLDCIERAKNLAKDRHRVTHDIFEYDPADENRLKLYPREAMGRFGWPLDAARINKLAMDIGRLNHDLLSLYRPLEPVASPQRRGTQGLRDPEPEGDIRDRPQANRKSRKPRR